MAAQLTFLKYECLVWFRKKENLFWAVAWPSAWLMLMVKFFPPFPGQTHSEMLLYYYPSAISLILLSSALTSLALSVASSKENKVFRRFKLLPVSLYTIFIVKMSACFIFTLISIASVSLLTILMGGQLSFNVIGLFLWIFFGFFSFSGVAFFISGVTSRVSSANMLSMLFMFLFMFLSTMFFDLSAAPSYIQNISLVLPGTPFCETLRAITSNTFSFSEYKMNIFTILVWGVATFLLAKLTFRTETE